MSLISLTFRPPAACGRGTWDKGVAWAHLSLSPSLLVDRREGGAAAQRRGEGLPSPRGVDFASADRREDRGGAAPREVSLDVPADGEARAWVGRGAGAVGQGLRACGAARGRGQLLRVAHPPLAGLLAFKNARGCSPAERALLAPTARAG
jgi:hypothetical protein